MKDTTQRVLEDLITLGKVACPGLDNEHYKLTMSLAIATQHSEMLKIRIAEARLRERAAELNDYGWEIYAADIERCEMYLENASRHYHAMLRQALASGEYSLRELHNLTGLTANQLRYIRETRVHVDLLRRGYL